MSDDGIDITHGGAIAVDTDALRDVAVRLGSVGDLVEDARTHAAQARDQVVSAPGLAEAVGLVGLWSSIDSLSGFRARIDEVITGIRLMADAFELVELRARRDAELHTDERAAAWTQSRIAMLMASDDRIGQAADYLVAGWEGRRYEGVDEQLTLLKVLGLHPAVFTGAVKMVGASDRFGRVRADHPLTGTADPVRVRPVATGTPIGPPGGLAEALRRMPDADGAQVRIERYTFADGSARYALYAKGTQSAFFGGPNPWDMRSNVQLYSDEIAASYAATVEALHQAGAGPGDVVDVYAHSQAGMIASHLAMESEFDVQTLVTAGSPVEPTLHDDQLLIQLRHTDDLVNALAGGGSPEGTGSPDSIVVQREGDPGRHLSDLWLEPHMMTHYVDTAEMVDASGDVRMDAYRERLSELTGAVSIESTEYEADRVGRAP